MTYTPRTFTKGGKTQVAETIEEDVQLLWEGWTPSTPYVTPRTQLPAHLNDLDALSATFARQTGGVVSVTGPTLPADLAAGTKYVWNKTDATTGDLLDILTGVI